jgi:hypothetical protein
MVPVPISGTDFPPIPFTRPSCLLNDQKRVASLTMKRLAPESKTNGKLSVSATKQNGRDRADWSGAVLASEDNAEGVAVVRAESTACRMIVSTCRCCRALSRDERAEMMAQFVPGSEWTIGVAAKERASRENRKFREDAERGRMRL